MSDKLFQARQWQDAIVQYKMLLKFQTGEPETFLRLSECYRQLNLLDESFNILREGIKYYSNDGNLYFTLIINLRNFGYIQEAINTAGDASKSLPDNSTFKFLKYLIVPIIYNHPEEIYSHRQRYTKGLFQLIQEILLITPELKQDALNAIGRVTNFYLSYQAQNDVTLQRQYGKLVNKIMEANYPNWILGLSMPSLNPSNKIRIGYISNYLYSYSGTLWLTGWLRHHNHNNFEIYCYHIGNKIDVITQEFQKNSDVFHHIPYDLETTCQQILNDKLHILVFPEIGMDAPTMRIAGLRLAPIQCVAWGHPVTTGLSTIDYFLSSELMEVEHAQEHYSEKLIRLPNIGVSYPKPYIPPISKSRLDYQLPQDAIIYLSCQAPFKYLPQYDFVFAEIAYRVPKAKFVFLRGTLLQERLQRAFSSKELNYKDYCIFLSIPERLDYLMINLLSDVYLDTFTWSGGNTSLEAIACNLPIVTCPSEFMRGRHTDSFLKMLGMTDTIASNEADYIDIAVKLGVNPEWRHYISKRMREQQDNLYDDKSCVVALEAFYKQVVDGGLNN